MFQNWILNIFNVIKIEIRTPSKSGSPCHNAVDVDGEAVPQPPPLKSPHNCTHTQPHPPHTHTHTKRSCKGGECYLGRYTLRLSFSLQSSPALLPLSPSASLQITIILNPLSEKSIHFSGGLSGARKQSGVIVGLSRVVCLPLIAINKPSPDSAARFS